MSILDEKYTEESNEWVANVEEVATTIYNYMIYLSPVNHSFSCKLQLRNRGIPSGWHERWVIIYPDQEMWYQLSRYGIPTTDLRVQIIEDLKKRIIDGVDQLLHMSPVDHDCLKKIISCVY